jgi:hypothetical protein
MSQADKEYAALERVRGFVYRSRELIERISAEDLVQKGGVNPYLARALGMRTVGEVVEFFVGRRVERSLGTSFGNVLDDVLRILLGGRKGKDISASHGGWIAWWDIVLQDRKVVISVKSGPADMDKDQVLYFAQRAREAEEKGFKPFLVFAYGKEAFPVIEEYLKRGGFAPEAYLRIGSGVFQEFLADPRYHKKALEVFGAAGERAGDILMLLEEKVKELTETLEGRYGGDVNRMLEDMF